MGTDTSSLMLVTQQVSHYCPIFWLYTTWSTDRRACSLLLEMCPCGGCFSLVWLHPWFVYDTAGQRFVMCPLSPSSTMPVSFGVARTCTGPYKRMLVCLCECRQCIRVCCRPPQIVWSSTQAVVTNCKHWHHYKMMVYNTCMNREPIKRKRIH